jgi:hypothetical protein
MMRIANSLTLGYPTALFLFRGSPGIKKRQDGEKCNWAGDKGLWYIEGFPPFQDGAPLQVNCVGVPLVGTQRSMLLLVLMYWCKK